MTTRIIVKDVALAEHGWRDLNITIPQEIRTKYPHSIVGVGHDITAALRDALEVAELRAIDSWDLQDRIRARYGHPHGGMHPDHRRGIAPICVVTLEYR